jgi:hypothetical protein
VEVQARCRKMCEIYSERNRGNHAQTRKYAGWTNARGKNEENEVRKSACVTSGDGNGGDSGGDSRGISLSVTNFHGGALYLAVQPHTSHRRLGCTSKFIAYTLNRGSITDLLHVVESLFLLQVSKEVLQRW